MEKLPLARRGCGAVCRALQESAAGLSVHHHHRYKLRILRNHAGAPPPSPPSVQIYRGSSVRNRPGPRLSSFFRPTGSPSRASAPTRPATEVQVNQARSNSDSQYLPPLSPVTTPFRDKVLLLLTFTFPQGAGHKAEVVIQNKNKKYLRHKVARRRTTVRLLFTNRDISSQQKHTFVIREPGFYQVKQQLQQIFTSCYRRDRKSVV